MGDNYIEEVGSGITTRTRRGTRYDVDDPELADAFEVFVQRHNDALFTPWGGNAGVIAAVRTKHGLLKNAAPSAREDLDAYNRFYAERETQAWYLRTIVMEAEIAERAVEEGRPWEAMSSALSIGELLTEMRMKQLWEAVAIYGQRRQEDSRRAGEVTRKGAQASRVAEVDRIAAEMGRGGKTAAFSIIAEREGVVPKTIQTDYYKARKSLS